LNFYVSFLMQQLNNQKEQPLALLYAVIEKNANLIEAFMCHLINKQLLQHISSILKDEHLLKVLLLDFVRDHSEYNLLVSEILENPHGMDFLLVELEKFIMLSEKVLLQIKFKN